MKKQVGSQVDKLKLRKRNGKLAFPELHCGPGPNCQAASQASVAVIRSILSGATTPADVDAHCQCQDRSTRQELRDI